MLAVAGSCDVAILDAEGAPRQVVPWGSADSPPLVRASTVAKSRHLAGFLLRGRYGRLSASSS